MPPKLKYRCLLVLTAVALAVPGRVAAQTPVHVSALLGDDANDGDTWATPYRTIGAARAIYLRQPADAELWHSRKEFVKIDLDRLVDILGPLAP